LQPEADMGSEREKSVACPSSGKKTEISVAEARTERKVGGSCREILDETYVQYPGGGDSRAAERA